MGTVGSAQTLTWPNSHMYLSSTSTVVKVRLVSIVGTLTVYSDIPQTQDLSRQPRRFNLWLVQLHAKISVPLP